MSCVSDSADLKQIDDDIVASEAEDDSKSRSAALPTTDSLTTEGHAPSAAPWRGDATCLYLSVHPRKRRARRLAVQKRRAGVGGTTQRVTRSMVSKRRERSKRCHRSECLVIVLSAGLGLYSTREGVSGAYTAVDHYRERLDMPSLVVRGTPSQE